MITALHITSMVQKSQDAIQVGFIINLNNVFQLKFVTQLVTWHGKLQTFGLKP